MFRYGYRYSGIGVDIFSGYSGIGVDREREREIFKHRHGGIKAVEIWLCGNTGIHNARAGSTSKP